MKHFKIEEAKINKKLVGDEIGLTPITKKRTVSHSQKSSKITLNDVMTEMRNGFKNVNYRIDDLETRIVGVETTLKDVIKINNLKTSPNQDQQQTSSRRR